MTLPHVLLAWTEVTPPAGISFSKYKIYRDGELLINPEALLEDLESVDTVSYNDYQASPNVAHTYEVSWEGIDSGMVIESAKSSDVATLTFTTSWLHAVSDPTKFIELGANRINRSIERETARARPRNRRAGTTYYGKRLEAVLDVGLVPEDPNDPELAEALYALAQEEVNDGDMLCLRLGFRPNSRYFVSSEGLVEQVNLGESVSGISLLESFYAETET